ncbi:uncharacterized protein LACBIDRAFT_310420 [Laccaria bicolor S238N-H82]|uniref:Predicted protein n=1 Tax=Laccaria bicolor (strain S238N-H82 / ATCC MYA-4686) TaxID=486041 RepID=B0E4W3_LACBS|nr:uncharacterized protein LACBIDRAFT_310420 [Laccaria bicolor S238N-H82]EDQ98118.1 predicted protein [Laccaria bicolor S238N-H82]|eukprot:XP_001891231.1 predicted protein [Laccaria bicolor S238N-H82]
MMPTTIDDAHPPSTTSTSPPSPLRPQPPQQQRCGHATWQQRRWTATTMMGNQVLGATSPTATWQPNDERQHCRRSSFLYILHHHVAAIPRQAFTTANPGRPKPTTTAQQTTHNSRQAATRPQQATTAEERPQPSTTGEG